MKKGLINDWLDETAYLQKMIDYKLKGSIFGAKVSYDKHRDGFVINTAITFQIQNIITKDILYRVNDNEEVIDCILMKAIQSLNNAMKNHLLGKDIK